MTNSNLMKMAENSPKWVENTVRKGEIAQAISPFSIVFSKDMCRAPYMWLSRKRC